MVDDKQTVAIEQYGFEVTGSSIHNGTFELDPDFSEKNGFYVYRMKEDGIKYGPHECRPDIHIIKVWRSKGMWVFGNTFGGYTVGKDKGEIRSTGGHGGHGDFPWDAPGWVRCYESKDWEALEEMKLRMFIREEEAERRLKLQLEFGEAERRRLTKECEDWAKSQGYESYAQMEKQQKEDDRCKCIIA